MKTLFLEKDSFARIKNINNKLIMYYSKIDKTALAIVNHKTLETEDEIELSLDNTIADVLYLNDCYYVLCYDINIQTLCKIIVINNDLKIVDIIEVEIFLGSTYYASAYDNKKIDLYFSNKSVVGRTSNIFKSNLSITCYYEDQEIDNKNIDTNKKILGNYIDNEYMFLFTRECIYVYDANSCEKIREEKIISPVNTEQMVMIEDDIICLITDECQYVLVNQVVQKL